MDEILERVASYASRRGLRPSVALVPDLARFNEANFQLYARLRGLPVRVLHLNTAARGIRSFEGFDYVVMTEREQGMPWTTQASLSLNQVIIDEHYIFLLLGTYPLPNGDAARLYHLRRIEREGG